MSGARFVLCVLYICALHFCWLASPFGTSCSSMLCFPPQYVFSPSLSPAAIFPTTLTASFPPALLLPSGVDVSIIGVYRGACAVVGFSTTILSPFIISRLGVVKVRTESTKQ